MKTAGNNVDCFSKACGRQEFLDAEVRELYHFYEKIFFVVDNGKQTRTRGQHRVYWIFHAPILMKFWNWSGVEIECEQLGEFLNAERAGSHRNKLKEAMSKLPVRLIDLSQGALVCLIQRLWQVCQCMLDTCWDAAADVNQLTVDPAEPTS